MNTRADRKILSPRTRKFFVLLHVLTSMTWLGLTIGNVTMAIAAATADRPETQHAIFRALGVIGDYLMIPVSLLAFATGVVLSLCTRWGLFRHKWVVVKFVLTSIAILLTPFSLVPGIHDLVTAVDATPAGQFAPVDLVGLFSAGAVSLTMYTTCTVLSVYKPWGRTRKPAPRKPEMLSTVDV
ncbi:hypothetical protein [Amycolatopsis anabasis]|uniref:hypothetical protein n=1 Tax=Amycolatopsis anabasis TaxID=1840409 RepID=UPI00131E7497|nr:hypothetical protein [Amycolatopsis anabasis]